MAIPIIKLEKLEIAYQGKAVLANVDLTIQPGEFCYLICKTGSGKSSLLKTIYGALPFKQGTGEVAGFDLAALDRKSIPFLRRKLGIVFQDFNLLTDRNVRENLLFVLKATDWKNEGEINNRIQEVLEQVMLGTKMEAMPHELSGGEQQRVVIARALLNKPDIILADEPTGNLDPETSDEILMLLKQLSENEGAAVLLATHDYRLMEQFQSRIIRCSKGEVFDQESFSI